MSRTFCCSLVVALVLGATPGQASRLPGTPATEAVATGLLPADAEQRLDCWFHEALAAIYAGHPSEARRLAEAMQQLAPDDPRPWLLQARILRIDVPDQNFSRDAIELNIGPIDSLLDRSIACSEAILKKDPDSVAGLLYRGWANMFKSQMRALSNQYWGAGRKAKAGKKDLDRVLELDPDNVDARFVQGAYLYFADILPGIIKVARFLVRIPGGDLERGIAYLREASAGHGYSRLDARALLGVIYFGFEGRFEDALDAFGVVADEFPENAEIGEPLAVIPLFLPDRLGASLPRLEHRVRVNAGSPEPWVRKVAARLRLYEALTLWLTGRAAEARDLLQAHLQEVPDQPDWLDDATYLLLADLDLMLGDGSAAAKLQASTRDRLDLFERLTYVLHPDAAAPRAEAERFQHVQPAVQALYDGRLDEAARGLRNFMGIRDPFLEFYRGELAWLQGEFSAARTHYQKLLEAPVAPRWRLFRFFAYLRAAEIEGRTGNTKRAARLLEEAIAFHDDRDLLRHVTKARRRFFENGRPGWDAGAAAPSAPRRAESR